MYRVPCPLGTMEAMASHPLMVGFDLDMTLIDSRPGIKACYLALSAETGAVIDTDLVVSRLGPPLEDELANWFLAAQVPAMVGRYREIYPTYAIASSPAMPGARESVEAIRTLGGRTMVVTAKYEPSAKLHLSHVGIEPDVLAAWACGPRRRRRPCASTGRPSTWATTRATYAAHAPRAPCRWA